ncbi:MAG: hypothetical protein ACI8QS_003317 [Planctomycetota bacterium]
MRPGDDLLASSSVEPPLLLGGSHAAGNRLKTADRPPDASIPEDGSNPAIQDPANQETGVLAMQAGRGPHWKLGLVAAIFGGLLLFHFAATEAANFQAQDLGLGRNTLPTVAFDDGRQISGPFEDMETIKQTFQELRAAGRPVILWIGASQLYAINQPSEGDNLAVWYATQQARARGSDFAYVMAANPNCNQTELFATYLSFRQEGLVPDALVIGFTYDDLKEPNVRQLVLENLLPLGEEELALGTVASLNIEAARAESLRYAATTAPVERTAVGGTPQERLENTLVSSLEERWPAYGQRGQLQAASIAAWKVPFTELVYRVFPRPKRLVPADMQAWNGAGWNALLDVAQADGVPTFVYKAPHRPTVDASSFYHDRRAYDEYHGTLEQQLEARSIPYVDLEVLVETQYWGTANDGSPDVFHFRDEGHRLLGESIDAWLGQGGF